jgi:hypothetical protein
LHEECSGLIIAEWGKVHNIVAEVLGAENIVTLKLFVVERADEKRQIDWFVINEIKNLIENCFFEVKWEVRNFRGTHQIVEMGRKVSFD